MDDKYVVFKRTDFFEMMGMLALPPYTGKTSTGKVERAGAHWDCAPIAAKIEDISGKYAVPDAVVIRRQDVFSAPALDAYASAIQVALEVLSATAMAGNVDGLDELRDIADFFSDQAAKAWAEQRKLPD